MSITGGKRTLLWLMTDDMTILRLVQIRNKSILFQFGNSEKRHPLNRGRQFSLPLQSLHRTGNKGCANIEQDKPK